MRKKKLNLHKETLRQLTVRALDGVNAAADYSYDGGETCCWCTDTCNACGGGKTIIARRAL